ncbi:transposase [Synechococcus sp. ATX 2A4]|uniref:transposase n=1 Tax=Synechococcus sp. ATX 2A4 TaxID=2823727 RepID=UPI0020CE1AF3|nr:transposase [Synechococcus sp. ATX 2A4]MCP9886296.1 transposase [Synechococcus sp. ATX 2A4]
MGTHLQRDQAIRRCLEQGQSPAAVASELGVAGSTLRGWLRWARLERQLMALQHERDTQRQRLSQIEQELQLASDQLETLRILLDTVVDKPAH